MDLQDLSMMSLNGIDQGCKVSLKLIADNWEKIEKIDDVRTLEYILNKLYSHYMSWTERQQAIKKIFDKVDLTTNEVNKFTFWDPEKAYTRNLVARDPNYKHYALLLLCWNAGRESKIHNHPCDGCFIKTIRGCIRETRYQTDPVTKKLKATSIKFYNEGQVSYMDDFIGFHKISNPSKDAGTVSLHLYTPPFTECKVWTNDESHVHDFEIGKVGFYSVYGNRSPHLEGVPGNSARLLRQIQVFDRKILRDVKDY
mmetsp:Transcript_17435/g.17528  ORF Transcript_17435/g.17528 Transcript_17435/m.17528 type:complete len:255 (+) Transcript_17435:92-856(+)